MKYYITGTHSRKKFTFLLFTIQTEQAVELFLFTDLIALARTRRSTNKLTIIRQLYFLDKVKLLKSQSSDTAIVFIYLDEGM